MWHSNKISFKASTNTKGNLKIMKLVGSHSVGLQATLRGKHEGGDALWEESRLGNYADSELRFVEIQENLCLDVTKGQIQCHSLAEKHEELLEEWWFHQKKKNTDLYNFLCIDSLKVCCPDNHYGPKCKPCSTVSEKPCSGHGLCEGAGTREGSGKCKCDEGYVGNICDKCKLGYFSEPKTNGDVVCQKCDKSCKSHCREGGPKGCEVCADGYQYVVDKGCINKTEVNPVEQVADVSDSVKREDSKIDKHKDYENKEHKIDDLENQYPKIPSSENSPVSDHAEL
ncbi:protein disulfide isomerase crld-1-like isoform X2 [Tachypleus tridentatus]|uniref:protein disulfide isomerase crld-1-like isoform X2 n=1 Tax=Tachypleus tridentatus TaxID=6853 RepID=UPI003FD5185D